MKKLKLFSLFLCLFVGLGQMWGAKITSVSNIQSGKKYYIGATKSNSTDYYLSVADHGASAATGKQGSAVTNKTDAEVFTFTKSGDNWSIQFESGNYLSLASSKANGKVDVVASAANWAITNSSNLLQLKINNYCLKCNSQTNTANFGSYSSGQLNVWLEEVPGGSSDPTLSVTPENITWEGIAANAEKSEEITVTLSNIEAVMAVLSGDNPTAFSIDKDLLDASGKIIVSKNTTTIGNYAATLTISDAATQTKNIALSMEVVADPEPTGTFEKFTGTIEEGDYVLVANGTTDALKNTITSDRFDCGTVEVADNKIVNPDKSVIWHIAANDAYWTMYNESTTSYAGGTTSRNQGALLNAVTDLAKWTITVDDKGVYTFENYGRSQQKSDANNKFLSKNGQNAYWATYASGQKNPVLYKKHVDVAVEKPTISGETSFLTSTTVTLACETEGATIYYTTDESDPKTSETKQTYSDAFTINADGKTTVRAIAYKGGDWSAEATSKTFTKITPDYTTIAAFLTDQPNTDKYIQFAGNVVVTGVNGKNVFIQDESGNAICLYFAANSTWTKGHKVTGMFQAKYATYGNMPEMSIADGNEGTIAATETAALPDPIEITSLEEATINANMCKYVVLKGVYFQGQSLTNKTVNLQDASSNELKFYDNLPLTSGKVLPLTATACDVTGVLISYKSGKDNINEILPVDVACINAGAAALPTLSVSGSTDEEHPTMVANGENITITPAAGFTSTLNGEPLAAATNISITETESNTVIAVSASRDYYATANATYYFKANPAGTKYAITVDQPEQGGILEANFAETEAGNIVTLTATPTNSHFTFDGWVVKKTGEPEASPETVTENQFSMPEYDVTVTGSFTEEGKATLIFAKGEADGEEAAPANIENYAGEVTLPACPFTYTGHYFIGWKKGETEDIYQPGAYTITAADVTAGTIAFTAQWAAGSIFEWVAGDHEYTDGQAISLVNSEPVAIKFAEGSKYFISDKTARFYTGKSLTITAPTDYVISKIELTTTAWVVNADKGTLVGSTWTGLAEEVVFTATATCKVKSLKVYYKEGSVSTLEIDDIEMEYGDVVTISPKTVTPETAASHVSYEIKAGSDDCITLVGDQITAKSVHGTATIVATIPDAEGGEYLGTSVEFTVRVSAPDSRKKAHSPNAGFTSISGDLNADIAYAAYKGGGTADAKINGTAIQLYQPGSGKDYGGFLTVTAVKGCKIDQVKITTATDATKISYSKDGGDLSEPQADNLLAGSDYLTPAELDAQSVNLYCMGGSSSNRLYVAAMTVYYTGEPVTLHHLKLSGDYPTEFEQGAAFSHEGLVVTACYDEGETDIEVVTASATISTPNMNVPGPQTITVSFGGKTAEYTITINAAAGTDDLTGTWNLVTDAADLMAGMKVIIAQHVESDGAIYTMGDQKTNNRDAVASTVAGTTLAPNFRTRVFVLEDAGNGMFALKSEENGTYLYAASSSSNNLKSQDDVDANAKWAISVSEGVASIVATNSTNRNVMQFNSSLFSCYGSASQADIALYARPFDYSRNVSGNYATICLPKAGQIIGATLYEIAYYGGASKKIFFDEIVNGEMEAGIPYIFQPAAGVEKINVYYSDNTAENVGAGNRNGLIGFYNLNNPEATHYITQDAGYYILYNNQYWLVSGRAAYVENYRAYIRLADITPSEPTLAPGRRRISMSVNDTQTATGFENAEANEAPHKVLINGELFIIRGEKMYDAKGQLVK